MTVGELLSFASVALGRVGVEAPRREARLLLAAASGIPTPRQIGWPDLAVGPEAEDGFRGLLARRLAGEPYSRIVQRREFWSLDFDLGPETLDPRPDSETLITAALARLPVREAPLRILDLGTGSGCLILSLLSELPNATGFGVDRSAQAIGVARGNARRLGLGGRVHFAVGDWTQAIRLEADLLISNPPYIPTPEIMGLDPGVRDFDPHLALDGGADGLDAYRTLLPAIPGLLAPTGFAILEIGHDQAPTVMKLAMTVGLAVDAPECDLAGRARAVICRRPSSRQ